MPPEDAAPAKGEDRSRMRHEQLGLDPAAEHQPDPVLLDLRLPDLPGQEVDRRQPAGPGLSRP
jgi:CheY-like chemotaxis protein